VGDDLGVGLAAEHIAARDQFGAQLVVVLDDAVVHEGDATGAGAAAADGDRCLRDTRAAAEVRVRVVHRRRAMRGPARVRDAGAGLDRVARDLGFEFGDARGAAGAAQLAALVHRDAAGVVAAVLEALQTLDQDRDDVAGADRTDDSAHDGVLLEGDSWDRRLGGETKAAKYWPRMAHNFIGLARWLKMPNDGNV